MNGDDIKWQNDSIPWWPDEMWWWWQKVMCLMGWHKRETRFEYRNQITRVLHTTPIRERDQCGRCGALLD
jgi:hypothetical protein